MDSNSYIKNQTYVKRNCISVDTMFRSNYSTTVASDFYYKFPTPIKNVLSMRLSSVELPNFWYMFSEKNQSNEFSITICNFYEMDPVSLDAVFVNERTHQIVLPEGNYYDNDLMNFMNSYFLNVKGGLEYIYFEINTNKGKCSFRARHKLDNISYPSPYDPDTPYYSSNFYYILNFNLLDRPAYLNMGWKLGFKQNQYIVTNANTYTNPFIYNELGIITHSAYIQGETTFGNGIDHYVFLDIEDYNKSFSNDSILSCLEDSYLGGNNIMARLTINTTSNSINFTNGSDVIFKKRQYFGPVTLDTIHIRILDKHGSMVHLNGNDFSFFIEMEILNK